MLKFVVFAIFALAMCGLTWHVFPATASHAFSVGGFAISWMMLFFLGYLYAGYKLTGK